MSASLSLGGLQAGPHDRRKHRKKSSTRLSEIASAQNPGVAGFLWIHAPVPPPLPPPAHLESPSKFICTCVS